MVFLFGCFLSFFVKASPLTLLDLPQEIKCHIVGYLTDPQDAWAAASACKDLEKIICEVNPVFNLKRNHFGKIWTDLLRKDKKIFQEIFWATPERRQFFYDYITALQEHPDKESLFPPQKNWMGKSVNFIKNTFGMKSNFINEYKELLGKVEGMAYLTLKCTALKKIGHPRRFAKVSMGSINPKQPLPIPRQQGLHPVRGRGIKA
jgi:hypothetical protein